MEANVPSAKSKRYKEMDVLRGLAALTVVFSHYIPHWDRYVSDIPVWIPNSFGRNAVLLFFATSGFVIFMTLEKCHSVLDFIALRFSRLYPAYWATLLFATGVTVILFGRDFWSGGFIANLTMFQEFIGIENFDNVYWSLTVELAFYLNVTWLLALGWHRYHARVVTVWLAVSCIWALTFYDPNAERSSLLAMLLALEFSPYFVIGIVYYQATKQGWGRQKILLLALAVATEFVLHGWFEAGKAFAAVVLLGLALSGWLNFIVTPVTMWLGAISYSLYLIHRNIGYALLSWLGDHQVNALIAITATTVLTLILASFFTYCIERPTQKRLRAAYAKWRDSTSPSNASIK